MSSERIKINKNDFIAWYLNDSDARWLLNDIKYELMTNLRFEIVLDDIFATCTAIPPHLRVDYNMSLHHDHIYKPKDCVLV